MLGQRSAQGGLFESDNLYLDHVGRDTFYGFLASMRGRLFRDEDFADLYCSDNGRDSVPPSLLATVLLLQTYERVSDEEAKARADFDVRWKVALGLRIEDRPFAKSTLQLFRAHLVLDERARRVFERSVALARESGLMRRRHIRVALDTSCILGKGAVKDTYNLLADGIVMLARALARAARADVKVWAKERSLARYFGSSVKGEASIDWDDESARRAFLDEIVADADRVLQIAQQVLHACTDESERERLRAAAELLERLLVQDIDRLPDGAAIKQEVAANRIVSVHDPEMHHGHKSKAHLFDGHKMAMAVDTESQVITAVDVMPGNAPDADPALDLVRQSEENTGAQVEETIADCAFGDGLTRQEFADEGRKLVARVPKRPKQAHLPKEDFRIDLKSMTCTCPAGQVTGRLVHLGTRRNRRGQRQRVRAFQFDAAVCDACPARPSCMGGRLGKGRCVSLHPQEALLQEARAFQHSEEYAPYRALRQVAEHRLARLMQLGARQARYFGRKKTLFQLLIAATVANLYLVARKTSWTGSQEGLESAVSSFCARMLDLIRAFTRRYHFRQPFAFIAQPVFG